MSSLPPPHRPAVIGQNQYGKAETRVVRVVREGDVHHVRDLNVSIALSGAMDEVHYRGDNANVLTTDATKNTVFAFARKYGIESAERFGMELARHFLTSQEAIHRARVRMEEYSWHRIAVAGSAAAEAPREHSFVRSGEETRTAQVSFDGTDWEIVSGLRDLTVLNTTDSEFWGYAKDEYTTLRETRDRILATDIAVCWRHGWDGGAEGEPHWDESYREVRRHILEAFAQTYSYSLQQTLYEMGARVVDECEEVEEIRFSLPNKHHFPVDLEPFGMVNESADGAVYFAADRPYGLIEGTVLRTGAEQRIPVDMTNL
ncbi:factor-independent urate hydroxylase [Streptomyces sp. TP-A0874]|uniref:factor-independent urate hydroxylase n=1 Tax=Streptomyces sp. TP-A0874 TaxID=549819 RepID=UPI0008529346|nr:urate oxidase [Streptomyces sp. TP-A0874]